MLELSIIVPVYKVENYLSKCIDSILRQEFANFELILVDDGSPDRCGIICDEYAAKDSRIKVIHQNNQGVSAARNSALNIASGTYLTFVDSDDWIDREMYKVMIQCAKETKADVVICGVNYFNDSGKFIRSDLIREATIEKEELLADLYGTPNPIGGACWNKVFLSSKIKDVRFRKNLTMAEDWVYLFECFKYCNLGYQLPKAFYNVTERLDSATRKNEVQAIYDIVFGGKYSLLLLAREYSKNLEKYATDKYLDDCIRYSNLLRIAGVKSKQPYRWKFVKIRLKMIKILLKAYCDKLLSKAKIHGYIFEIFRG